MRFLVLLLGLVALIFWGCSRQGSSNLESGQARERAVISVLHGLKAQVNAETEDNGIPWCCDMEQSDVTLTAQLSEETTLASVVKGGWSYTLYKFTYTVMKVEQGECRDEKIVFFIERAFPAPGSSLRLKELWPFSRDKPLNLKLRKGVERYRIVSIRC